VGRLLSHTLNPGTATSISASIHRAWIGENMDNGKPPHILNASSNLLGICFIIITGLRLTNLKSTTLADEIGLFAALTLLSACLLSYLSIRIEKETLRLERWADYLFITGMISLFIAISTFSTGLF
jgi:hypothetical protein